jgi:CubicO group peptidase (beta-lactamase class C family)
MSLQAFIAGTAAALVLTAGMAFAQAPAETLPAAVPPVTSAAGATSPAAHSLDAADINTWLDGFMPLALADGNIAGAVVVIVKDSQILTQRGFGVADVAAQTPVDPAKTLFRIGSTSKLFTWTAVMQLVEAGKIDLDTDVNTYLDFKIPPAFGKPITLRNIMTHTAGFEEHAKQLFVATPAEMPTLGAYLKSWVPIRIFPPGQVPAYSNYGAAVAGYIVQRVSGEPFADYIRSHIFQPLGMVNATFAQPVPAGWAPNLALGYQDATGEPHPFELIPAAPAGSVSVAGADMAPFMIAHLNDGRFGAVQILKPETAKLMHATAFAATPPLPGMALGFYHEDRNGHVIIGHGGDTETFHADFHLFLNDGVGLFVSFNSLGDNGGAHTARTLLFQKFTDRYFPASPAAMPTLASAKSDAALVAGTYISSRRSDTSFFRLLYLAQETKIAADASGIITDSDIKAPGDAPDKWREVAPFVWQKLHGTDRLAFVVKNNQVQAFGMEGAPFEVFQPATGAYAPWNLLLLEGSLAVLAVAAVLWPVVALVRRRYGKPFPLAGVSAILYRLVRAAAVVGIALAIGWVTLITIVSGSIVMLNDSLNPWLRALQVLGVLGVVGGLVGVLNLIAVWCRHSSWWAKLSATLVACATVGIAWIIISQDLVTASLEF